MNPVMKGRGDRMRCVWVGGGGGGGGAGKRVLSHWIWVRNEGKADGAESVTEGVEIHRFTVTSRLSPSAFRHPLVSVP